MIRFLNDETVAGHRYGKGIIARFDDATEAALIAQADAEYYPAVLLPIEVLSSSAAAVSCASTATDEVLASFVIPAGTIGVNSGLQFEPLWTYVSSANNKILKIIVGGVTIYNATRTTSNREAPMIGIWNRNSLTSQIQHYTTAPYTAGSGFPAIYTIDFSVAVTVQITANRATAELTTLEGYRVLHYGGA